MYIVEVLFFTTNLRFLIEIVIILVTNSKIIYITIQKIPKRQNGGAKR